MYTTSFLLGGGTHVQMSGFKINRIADPYGNSVEEQPGSGLIPLLLQL